MLKYINKQYKGENAGLGSWEYLLSGADIVRVVLRAHAFAIHRLSVVLVQTMAKFVKN